MLNEIHYTVNTDTIISYVFNRDYGNFKKKKLRNVNKMFKTYPHKNFCKFIL